jgi:hypothetical protein
MSIEPRGRFRKFTDEQLRADLDASPPLSVPAIAAKYGVTKQAVYKRVDQLERCTTAAAVAPAESERYVSRTINAMDELTDSLETVKLLKSACDEWLRHPERPGEYDLSPRADEITVHYEVIIETERSSRVEKRREKLSTLLSLVETDAQGDLIFAKRSSEFKHADPRELILKTTAECRQIITTAADLAKMLADARLMEEFRQALLDEIRQVSPDVAQAIADRVRRRLVLHSAFRGPDALPGA